MLRPSTAVRSAAVVATALIALLAPSAPSASTPLVPAASPVVPTTAGPGAVVEMHMRLFHAIDAADATKASAFVGPAADASMIFTAEGKTRTLRGRDKVVARVREWARKSELGDYETTIEPISADCTSGDLSYAVLDIRRTMTSTKGGPILVARYLSTSLVQYRDGGWKLLHWHLTPIEVRDS
jgi:ketosteroid isomerase-like protein